MINATEMAKLFRSKTPTDFLRLQQTKAFIEVFKSQDGNSHLGKIINVIHGGSRNGTWIHEKLALKFAAWLSPEFELWFFDKIQGLLLKGYTSINSVLPRSITYIYFVKATKLNLVKIGMTENLHHRLNNLKVNSSDGLELQKVIRTNDIYSNDQAIHLLFPHLLSHGEWYFWTDEL